MIYKVGQYHYAPRGRNWGVWKCVMSDEKGNSSSEKVTDFQTKEEARQFVYKMNGWSV